MVNQVWARPILVRSDQFWMPKMVQADQIRSTENGLAEPIFAPDQTFITGDVNICRGIYQGDSLSPLLFVLALMPISTLLNQSGKGFQIVTSLPKLSHLLYLDDLKLYAKSQAELEHSEDI